MSTTVSATWEDTLTFWAKPPAKTEQERCENAERAVRNAISASVKLKNKSIKVFSQGSYRNNTNVRNDSDVDLGVLCYDTFFFNLPEGRTREQFGIGPGTYAYEEFKNDVGKALVDHFGSSSIHRGER